MTAHATVRVHRKWLSCVSGLVDACTHLVCGCFVAKRPLLVAAVTYTSAQHVGMAVSTSWFHSRLQKSEQAKAQRGKVTHAHAQQARADKPASATHTRRGLTRSVFCNDHWHQWPALIGQQLSVPSADEHRWSMFSSTCTRIACTMQSFAPAGCTSSASTSSGVHASWNKRANTHTAQFMCYVVDRGHARLPAFAKGIGGNGMVTCQPLVLLLISQPSVWWRCPVVVGLFELEKPCNCTI